MTRPVSGTNSPIRTQLGPSNYYNPVLAFAPDDKNWLMRFRIAQLIDMRYGLFDSEGNISGEPIKWDGEALRKYTAARKDVEKYEPLIQMVNATYYKYLSELYYAMANSSLDNLFVTLKNMFQFFDKYNLRRTNPSIAQDFLCSTGAFKGCSLIPLKSNPPVYLERDFHCPTKIIFARSYHPFQSKWDDPEYEELARKTFCGVNEPLASKISMEVRQIIREPIEDKYNPIVQTPDNMDCDCEDHGCYIFLGPIIDYINVHLRSQEPDNPKIDGQIAFLKKDPQKGLAKLLPKENPKQDEFDDSASEDFPVGYLVKYHQPHDSVFIHKSIRSREDLQKLFEVPRGVKPAGVANIKREKQNKPKSHLTSKPPPKYILRDNNWISKEYSRRTVYRVLNLPAEKAARYIKDLGS